MFGSKNQKEVTVMTREQKAIIGRVTKKYGPTIDLKANPEVLIEILRTFGRLFDDDPDGGSLPGGVPEPPPPPDPCIVERITMEDVMRAILKLTREVATIKAAIGTRGGRR
jgi:hypothetical protein